jgi:hypothetical protein
MAHIRLWYILIRSNNIPLGEPFRINVGHNDDIQQLKTDMKDGMYKEDLARVKLAEMEVWRCKTLTLI